MRIFREQKALHGFAAGRIQLLEDAPNFRVYALIGCASFSGLFVPFMAFFEVAQFHMHRAKQRTWAVVLRHQRMRCLAHLNRFCPPPEIAHRPATSRENCRSNLGLFEAIRCNAVDQPESHIGLIALTVVPAGVNGVPWILRTPILIGMKVRFKTVIRLSEAR